MKPHPRQEEQDDLLRPRLTDMIDMRHELAKLAALIDWDFFEREWAGFFPSHRGAARDVAAAGGGVAIPAACVPAVGRGGCRVSVVR